MKALWQFFGLSDPSDASDASDQRDDQLTNGDAPPPPRATVIGPGVSVKGELRGEGALTMLGQFEGEMVLDGAVHIGPAARVDANITASEIVIAGAVRGNLAASGRVEILGSGSLTGTLKSGSLSAGSGATVKGEVWVEPATDSREAMPRR